MNIAVQNSTLVARAEASHASRFFKRTWTALFKEQKEYGSGATFIVGKKAPLSNPPFFVCVGPWGVDEEYPKWIAVCSLCSFQIWGSIP